VAEELFLRAREIVERLDDEGLTGMLAVLERRESASRDDVARRPEIVRAAARVARALG
jgi:hypothetical protein